MNEIMPAVLRQSTFVVVGGSKSKIVEGIMREKGILEWLYTKEWFQVTKNSNHPAFMRWKTCNLAIQWGGSKPDSMRIEQMLPIARVALDASLLVKLTEGDLMNLSPGKIEAVGDAKVRNEISARKLVANQFEDLFVELYTAAWHKRVGRTVTLLQGNRLPDVRVDFDSIPFPVFIECKRLKVSSAKTIQKRINDASKKIETASTTYPDAYGAALLDFSAALGAFEAIDNSIPEKMHDVLGIVKNCLRGEKNTHVKSAIVVWDDFHVDGEVPQPVLLTSGRRAKIFHHEKNQNPLGREFLFEGNASHLLMQQTPDEFMPENAGI